MRRCRVPTIPKVGLLSPPTGGEPLQPCDSAIFADAEEEYLRPEKRPTAPHMFGLRRRNTSHEEGRYDDANCDENPLEKRPSTKMRTLVSLTSLGGVMMSMERREDVNITEKDEAQILTQKEQAAGGIKHSGGSVIRIKPASTPVIARSSEQVDISHLTGQDSSNDVTTKPQKRALYNELKRSIRKVSETAVTIRNRLHRDTFPAFQRKTQAALTFLVANILALFSFLKRACLIFIHFLGRLRAKQLQGAERGSGVPSSSEPPEESRKDAQTTAIAKSTTEMRNEMEVLQSRTFLRSCDPAPQRQGESASEICTLGKLSEENRNQKGVEIERSEELPTRMHNDKEKGSPPLTLLKSCKIAHEPEKQSDSVVHDNRMRIPCPRKAEETSITMTTAPLPDSISGYTLEDGETEEHPSSKAKLTPNVSNLDSGPKDSSRSSNERSSNVETRVGGSGSEPSTEYQTQDGNLAEDLMSQLDQSSLRLEHKDSEIILSPLKSTTPAFLSDGEFDIGHINRANYLRRGMGIAELPGRQCTELDQRTRLEGRMRSSRGPTGKLKSDVRTMRESLFRVFARSKIEPETRFASPRSARKTLALVADMLVKEHGCNVAIRRNGALKMRCEKSFSGSQKLRVRLAFQSIDAFSCNVIVCRSREDDLKVSTTDYVSFVADLQRSFLNATSEGMHGTHD